MGEIVRIVDTRLAFGGPRGGMGGYISTLLIFSCAGAALKITISGIIIRSKPLI